MPLSVLLNPGRIQQPIAALHDYERGTAKFEVKIGSQGIDLLALRSLVPTRVSSHARRTLSVTVKHWGLWHKLHYKVPF